MGAGLVRLICLLAAAGAPLTNSIVETVLSSTVSGLPLPAYSLQPNKAYKVRGGVRATATNATDTLRVRVRFGPTTLTGTVLADSTAVDVANDDIFVFDLTLTVRSVGSASEVIVTGTAGIIGIEGTATMRQVNERLTGLDSGVAQRIEVTGLWSVANAGNSCQLETFTVEEMA